MKTKYTVITGASLGIGRAVALKFAERNKNLILIARRNNLLEDLKSEILKKNPNLDILVIDFDLTDVGKIPELYSKLNNYHIETLINNAGFGMYGDVKEQSLNKTSSQCRSINFVIFLIRPRLPQRKRLSINQYLLSRRLHNRPERNCLLCHKILRKHLHRRTRTRIKAKQRTIKSKSPSTRCNQN